MAYRIIQGYQNKEVVVSATLDKYDIYIMPIVNPDGKLSHTFNLQF